MQKKMRFLLINNVYCAPVHAVHFVFMNVRIMHRHAADDERIPFMQSILCTDLPISSISSLLKNKKIIMYIEKKKF